MKTLLLVLIFLACSLFLGGISKAPRARNASFIIVQQDTIKKKMTDEERKKMELEMINKRVDKKMITLQKQNHVMDSLMGKKDTTKIKK